MRKKGKLEKEKIQNVAASLANLSRKDSKEVSRKTAAGLLKAQVRAARARGATWAEIAEVLKEQGLDISIKTLARELDNDAKAKAVKKDTKMTKGAAPAKAPGVAAPPGAGAVPPPPPVAGEFVIKKDRGAGL